MTKPSTFETIVDSFKQGARKRYTPQFSVKREPTGWRLLDRERAIGFVGRRGGVFFDLWSFSPFEPDVMANTEPCGKVVDMHTLHNTYINFPFTSGHDLVEGVDDPASRLNFTWRSRAGKELDLEAAATFEQGQRIVYHFRVVYDAAWARYRFFFDVDAWKLEYNGFEPLNMMIVGALASRPEKQRWTHSLWEDPDGRLQRLVHSNALFEATDYASNGNGQWRSRNPPLKGAWVGYAADKTFNPAMLIHHTNAPLCFATCSQLFDEHLIWQQAGLDDLDEGFFRFSMRTELVNIGAGLVGRLLRRAEDPPCPATWRKARVALPFHMDVENSFERSVDPWEPETCPIFVVDAPSSGLPVCWDGAAGHTGSHSLRLEGAAYHGWTRLATSGAVCNVEPHARYRLSAWVKTRRVERFARIELASFEYTNANIIDTAESPKAGGSRGWTRLEVELDTGDEAYVMPKLALYGTGTAWFDDVKLERIS